MTSEINVTVRLPFSDDRNLVVSTGTTVSELISTVLNLISGVIPQEPAQCIMYRGRILDNERTLSELQVPNHAVLQMMPRPRRVSRLSQTGDPQMFDPEWEGSEDHDHEHDHVHEHVHTNVLISHVGFSNRRAQYSDVQEMLVSLFQALGFSTRGVNSAASIAAALLISFDSGVQRGSPSPSISEAAWSVVRLIQERLSTPLTNSNSNHYQAQTTRPGNSSTEGPSASPSSAPQADLLLPLPRPTASFMQTLPVGSGAVSESLSATPQTSIPDRQDGGEHASPASLLPRISVLPEVPPRSIEVDSDRLASARAADVLVPALREMISNLEYRLANATSFVDIVEGESTMGMAQLIELTGATAGAMTAVATLMSSILPGEDDEDGESENFGFHRSNSSQRRRHPRPQSDSDLEVNERHSDQQDGQNVQRSRHTRTGSNQTQDTPGAQGSSQNTSQYSPQRSADNNTRENVMNTSNHRGNGPLSRISHLHFDNDEEEERNHGSYQQVNADFLVRLLSYYYCSLSEGDFSDDVHPHDNSGSAVDVLQGLYGSSDFAPPRHPFLSGLYKVMEMLTPFEFHQVCRGDFSPIAEYRFYMVPIIFQELSDFADHTVQPNTFDESFVNFVCEKFHQFIHVLDAYNRDNDGGLHHASAEHDLCHFTMQFIHRMVLRLLDILTGRPGDGEYATKLRDWFSDSLGGVVYAFGEPRGLDWESTVHTFRQACNDVGVAVLGGQFSVIFPLILNLFLGRARVVYDRLRLTSPSVLMPAVSEENQQHGEQDFDHSRCGPGCHGRQVQEFRANQRSSPESRGADSDLDIPDLVSDTGDSCNDDTPSILKDADTNNPRSLSRVKPQVIPRRISRNPMEVDHDIELDNQDFDDIVAELNSELMPSIEKRANTVDQSDEDLNELVKELEEETGAGPSTIHNANEAVGEDLASKHSKISATERGPPATLPAASVLRGPRIGGSFPSGRSPFGSSTIGQTAFSSTAVPIARSSANYSGARFLQSSDDFQVLGSEAAERWRSVVQRDQSRMSELVHDPPSNGYRYDMEPQGPLNDISALRIFEQGLEAAAKEIPLTAPERNGLHSILKEETAEGLDYVESEIRSRILDEDDFRIDSYPTAASRFLGWADMPE
ncbi:unnamed protein product [Agarophyton chilense]